MGGFSQAIEHTVGPELEHVIEGGGKSSLMTGVRKSLTSIESIMNQHPASKLLMEHFKNFIDPEIAAGERSLQEGIATKLGVTDPKLINQVAIPTADKQALHNTILKRHLGENQELVAHVINEVHNDTKLPGTNHSSHVDLVADSWDILTHQMEHRPGWRQIATREHDPAIVSQYIKKGFDPFDAYGMRKGKPSQVVASNPKLPQTGYGLQMNPTFRYNQSITQGEGERATNNIMRLSMLGHITLNHLGMPLMGIMRGAGVMDVLRTFGDSSTTKEQFKNILLKQGLFMDEFNHEAKAIAEGRGWLSGVLNTPAFSTLRKMQLSFTGRLGGHVIEENVEDLLSSGGSNKTARGFLASVGINPDEVLRNGKLAPEDFSRGMYRFASDVMLKYSAKDLPPAWQATLAGRMATLYKGFQFREGKFIKDQLMRVYNDAGGGVDGIIAVSKWMAKFTTLVPLVGAISIAATNVATGKDPREDLDYINALAFSGGLGIGMTTVNAARRHALTEMIAGPVVGRALNLVGDAATGQYESVARDVIGSLGWPGRLVAGHYMPTRHQMKEEVDLGDRSPRDLHPHHHYKFGESDDPTQKYGAPPQWKRPQFIPFAPSSRYKKPKASPKYGE